MPDSVNPRLLAEAEGRLALDEDHFEISDNPIETVTQPTEQTAQTLEQVAGKQPNLYALDPEDFYGSLRRLADADPRARNVLKSFSGRTNKADEARLAALEAELANERLTRAAMLVASVPDEDAESMYMNNETYAQAYDLVADSEMTDPSAASEDVVWANAIDTAFESVEGIVPGPRLDQYKAALNPGACGDDNGCALMAGPHGMYDHDQNGRELSRLEALDFLRNALAGEAATAQRAVAAARPPAPAPTADPAAAAMAASKATPAQVTPRTVADAIQNSRGMGNRDLGDARPDMQTGSAMPTAPGVISMDEYRQMPIDERLRRWPNEGDFERAYERGEIMIPALQA